MVGLLPILPGVLSPTAGVWEKSKSAALFDAQRVIVGLLPFLAVHEGYIAPYLEAKLAYLRSYLEKITL